MGPKQLGSQLYFKGLGTGAGSFLARIQVSLLLTLGRVYAILSSRPPKTSVKQEAAAPSGWSFFCPLRPLVRPSSPCISMPNLVIIRDRMRKKVP